MTRGAISDLIAGGEGATVEFKRSLARDIGRELCAFTNAGGGTVLIGVTDAGKVVGVADHNRLKARVLSTARSADPPIELEVESAGEVLHVAVPLDERADREAAGGLGRRPESQRESGAEASESGLESAEEGLESKTRAGLESEGSGLESLDRRVLALLAAEPLSRSAIADGLGHRSVSAGLNRVIQRLLKDGRAEYTVPDKPNSRLQKYRITKLEQSALEEPEE